MFPCCPPTFSLSSRSRLASNAHVSYHPSTPRQKRSQPGQGLPGGRIADPAARDLLDELSAEGSGCKPPCPNHAQRGGFRCRRRRDVRRVQDARRAPRRGLRGHEGEQRRKGSDDTLPVVAWRSPGRRKIRDGGDLSTTGIGKRVSPQREGFQVTWQPLGQRDVDDPSGAREELSRRQDSSAGDVSPCGESAMRLAQRARA